MNNTSLLPKYIAALLLALCVSAGAQFMEAKEYAAEIDNVEFGNAPTSGGLIFVKRCDQCNKVGVTFRAQTQFFDGKRAISALAAEQLTERGATLLYDAESRYVTRVIFWPAS